MITEDNTKINKAIGVLMGRIKKSGELDKPIFKRALLHLNLARTLENLGHTKFAEAMVGIAHTLVHNGVLGKTDPMASPPVDVPSLNKTIGLCMHVMKGKGASTDADKATAKEALGYFNLARTTAGLGYGKLTQFLIRTGEHKLAQIDRVNPVVHYDDDTPRRAAGTKETPPRPAPPAHPNPIIRNFDRARHSVQTALDKFGIIT
jgi:hypothetical protein